MNPTPPARSMLTSALKWVGCALLLGWCAWIAYCCRNLDGTKVPLPTPGESWFLLGTAAAGTLSGTLLALLARNALPPAGRIAAAAGLLLGVTGFWRMGIPALLAQSDAMRTLALLIFGTLAGGVMGAALGRNTHRRLWPAVAMVIPFIGLAGLAGQLLMVLAVGLCLIAAAGVGRALQEKCCPDLGLVSEALLLSLRLALGFLALSMLGFVLGVVHLAYPTLLFAALALLPWLTRQSLRRELRSARDWLTQSASSSGNAALITGAAWSILLIGWITVLAPEVGPDALGGRQAVVGMWAADHWLAGYREMNLSLMATAGETFFLTLFPLAGQQAAKLGQWLSALALIPFIFGILPQRTSAAGSLPLAFATSTLVLLQFAWGFVDLVQTLFYVTALLAGHMWWRLEKRNILLLAGALGAGAVVVKLNGMGVLIVLTLVIAVRRLKPAALRPLVSDILIMGLAASAVMVPWLVRSYLLSGNPIFPYANGVFHSPMAPTELISKRFGDPHSLVALLRLPWDTFFFPGRFVELGAYHPLLLAALPLVFTALRSSLARYWILTGLAAGLLWWLTEQNLRYSLFAVLLLTLGVAVAIDDWLGSASASWRRCVAGLMIGALLAGSFVGMVRPTAWLFRSQDTPVMPLSFTLRHVSREDYLAVQLPHTPVLRKLDQIAGRSAVVWELPFLRDHLHLAGRAIAMPHCDVRLALQLRGLLDLLPSPENFKTILRTLRSLGITHLLLPPDSPWSPRSPDANLSALFSREFRHQIARVEAANLGYILLSLPTEVESLPVLSSGPNLLLNPTLEMSPDSTTPTSWVPNAPLPATAGPGCVLPAGHTLYQGVAVKPGGLYEFNINLPSEAAPGGTALLHAGWRAADGRLVAYHSFVISVTQTRGLVEIIQNAPERATHLDLTLRGPLVLRSISLQELGVPVKATP